MKQENILIIDDEQDVRTLLKRLLEDQGYGCTPAAGAAEARAYLEKQTFDLLLCDIRMPGESGLDLIQHVARQYPDTALVMLTGVDDPEESKIALNAGVYGYILKPFEPNQILISIANALRRRELEMAQRRHLKDLEQTVAERTENLKQTNLKLQQKISEHQLALKEIAESEQKYRLLISHIPGFVYTGDKDWNVDFTNNKVGELTGYDKKDFDARRLKWSDLIDKADFKDVVATTKQALGTQDSYIREYRIKTKSGRPLWIQDRGRIIRNQKGEIDYFSGIFFDITRQKKAEEKLGQNERYFRSILKCMHDNILVIDQNYQITDVNETLLTTTGFARDEVLGRRCYEVTQGNQEPCDRYGEICKLPDVFKTGKPQHCLHQHVLSDGSKFWCDIMMSPLKDAHGTVTHVIEAGRDVTEKKQAEEALVQTEKMASIGQLAAGVAHEINNPTGFVSSNLKTLFDYIKDISNLTAAYRGLIADLKADSNGGGPMDVPEQIKRISALEEDVDIDFVLADILELIEESRDGTERIRTIIQDLKDFAHPGEDKPQYADINKNLDSTLNVVRNELKYKAEIVKDYGRLPQVHCYPQMLNQVFMNLMVNAAQAIEERGEIRIQTRADNGHVKIKVSDTGAGIPKENIARIFDPFFTTKDVGKGTGLGLNVAYNIIKKHHGKIDVQSEVGQGTTFTINIPVE